MSNTSNINTFAQLEKRKKELDLEVEISKRELAHSLGQNRDQLKDFLVQKVAMPVGIAIGGIWLLRKLTKKRRPDVIHERVVVEKDSPNRKEQRRGKKKPSKRRPVSPSSRPTPPPGVRSTYPPAYAMQADAAEAAAAAKRRQQFGSEAKRPAPPVPPTAAAAANIYAKPGDQRPKRPADFTAASGNAPTQKSKPESSQSTTPAKPAQMRDGNREEGGLTKKQEEKAFDIAKLMAVGRVLLPAGKMIFEAIEKHKTEHAAQTATSQRPAAEIAEKDVKSNLEPLGAPTA